MIYVDGYKVPERYFPDNTLNMTGLSGVFTEMEEMGVIDVANAAPAFTILWKYQSPVEQIMLYNIVNHLRDHCCASTIQLILPYVPNARMDRTKNQFTEVHTLKYFCKFINDLHFDLVMTLDVHSDVTATLLNNHIPLDYDALLHEIIDQVNPDFLYFPDAGCMKRLADKATRTYFYGEKFRDWSTGKIKGVDVRNPFGVDEADYKGKHILIVDDICSRGGTFLHSGNALKEMGFGKIDLFVTHCENTIFAGELLKDDSPINHIYTTDSLVHSEHEKITTDVMEFTED